MPSTTVEASTGRSGATRSEMSSPSVCELTLFSALRRSGGSLRSLVLPDRRAGDLVLDGPEAGGVRELADVVGPHHDGVVAALVVALADAGGDEAEPLVQLLRGDVAHAHLERQRG